MIDSIEVFFDASIPKLVEMLAAEFGPEALSAGLVVRDTSGRLRFLSAMEGPSGEVQAAIEAKMARSVGAYALADHVIAFSDEPGVPRLLSDPGAFPMQHQTFKFRLLDRRIVGSGWIDRPKEEACGPPRIVFASLKGGVGRSTALAVTAADLSRRNKNVLVIDLDLEAPGLGDTLLDDDRTPLFGSVDYLVENGLGGVAERRLADFIGTSALTTAGGGRVDVLPALGTKAREHPGNTIAKLSRAMIEDIGPEGAAISVADQIADMVARFATRDSYDVILLDSRAGLSELAASAILGLGGTVLLFGTAQRQTIHGYRALFAGLKLLAQRDRDDGRAAEWRLLLKAVYAKAGMDPSTQALYRDDLFELFAENLYDADDGTQENPDAVSFDIDDENGPHWPLIIPFTQNFVEFDPVRVPSQLNAAFYEQAFRPFLNGIDSIMESSRSAPGGPEREQ